MNRRHFLRNGALSTVPVWLNGLRLGAVPFPFLLNQGPDHDRVLVLIQLNGGNDGLNCIVPLDQYSTLSALRSNIVLPESTVLPVEDGVGFHPAMSHLRNLYTEGKMSIVQSVGYPDQDRSHFRSTDIWTSGSAANQYLSTGWLGRYFHDGHPAYPDGYPNGDFEAPFALTMGSLVSETCQGSLANYSLALNDPFALTPLSEAGNSALPDNNYGRELRFLIEAIAQTNAFAGTIVDAAESGSNQVEYPEANRLANQLKNVALLISGGLRTKVYVVSLGGFDTHSGQVVADTTQGTHAVLLQQLSEAVDAFQRDLKLAGKEDKVLTMTFSEFGRQIRSNDSMGTDHGNAAPLMLFGPCVRPGILGENPQLDLQIEPQSGVPMQYDFRSVYATVLKDWLGMEASTIQAILHPDVQFLPLIEGCSLSTFIQEPVVTSLQLKIYPNPASNSTSLEWESNGDAWSAGLLDQRGYQHQIWSGGKGTKGPVVHKLTLAPIPAGQYFIHLRQGHQSLTRGIVIL